MWMRCFSNWLFLLSSSFCLAQTDHFTEFFENEPADLASQSITFYPVDGGQNYVKCVAPALSLSVSPLLGDETDDNLFRFDLPRPFPFYGRTFDYIYIHENGFFTLNSRDPFAVPSYVHHFSTARIAPFWKDHPQGFQGVV